MSIEAVSWALNRAPVSPSQLGVLIALADKADDLGRGAWPSRETIAYQARKTVKQVTRDLKAMQSAGVIRRGDQRRTAYLPRDRRPVVYDLCMERTREDPPPYREHPSGATHEKRGDASVPPAVDNPKKRGDTGVPPVSDRGDIQGRPGGHTGSTGGTPMSPKPPLNLPEPHTPQQAPSLPNAPVVEGVVGVCVSDEADQLLIRVIAKAMPESVAGGLSEADRATVVRMVQECLDAGHGPEAIVRRVAGACNAATIAPMSRVMPRLTALRGEAPVPNPRAAAVDVEMCAQHGVPASSCGPCASERLVAGGAR